MNDAEPKDKSSVLGKLRRLFRTRRARVIAIVAAIAVLAGVGGGWYLYSRTPSVAQVTTREYTVEATTLKTTVSTSGTLEPKRRADLAFNTAGTVTSVNVAVGDVVTADQQLATIDDSSLRLALSAARADLNAAQDSLDDLRSSGGSTAAITTAKAKVAVKSNDVATAKSNLAAATMVAPFDGIIAEVNIEYGDTISGSSSGGSAGGGMQNAGGGQAMSSSTSGSAIILISNDSYTVSTSVTSSDVASIKRGLQAELTLAGSSETLYGTVSEVAVTASSSDSGTATFPVAINVTGKHKGLFAGSTVSVEIITSQLTDVLAVPTEAVTTTDDESTVEKIVDGVATTTKVTLGETVDGSVVITDGLSEGDQVQVPVGMSRGGGTQDADQNGQFPSGQIPNGSGGFPGGGMEPPSGGFPGGQQGGGQQGGRPNR